MDYMTLREASEKWGISTRQINYYCAEDRIPGAVKKAEECGRHQRLLHNFDRGMKLDKGEGGSVCKLSSRYPKKYCTIQSKR